ncbi:MAG: hypothetical protein ACI4LO_09635 [Anaerovoracaceae bacterium]
MIDKLNEKALVGADQKAFRVAVIRKVNQLVEAMNTGVVWDNKVQADREHIQALASIADVEYRRIINEFEKVIGGTENV